MVDTNSSNSEPMFYVPLPPTLHNSIINDEHDGMYNYELMNSSYLESCKDYYSNTVTVTGPWTQKARKTIINMIRLNEIVSMDKKMYNLEFKAYQIVLDEGEEKLVLAGTSTEVLPYEECFDIFFELHKNTEHGGSEVILAKLEKRFEVHSKCLEIFLLKCNFCKKSRLDNLNPVAFNDSIVVEILKSPMQDDECRYILFYMDRGTSYMIIRPLITMDEYELSLEMLKIFTDYGPPLVIETMHTALLNNVLIMLGRGGFKYHTFIYRNDQIVVGKSYALMEQIVTRRNPGSTNWASTCRFVQHSYNVSMQSVNTRIDNTYTQIGTVKPHLQLFSTKYPAKYEVTDESETLVANEDSNTIILDDLSHIELSATEDYELSSDTNSTSENDEVIETKIDMQFNSNQTFSDTYTEVDIQNSINTVVKTNAKQEECPKASDSESTDVVKEKPTVENSDIETYAERDVHISDTIVQTDTEKDNCTQACNSESSYAVKQERSEGCSDTENENKDTIEDLDIKTECDPLNMCDGASQMMTSSVKKPMNVDESLKALISDIVFRPGSIDKAKEIDKSTQTDFTVNSKRTRNTRKKVTDMKDKQCCVCEGKMLTNYFCFGCKRDAHIFCMVRISKGLEKRSDPMISFTYCDSCTNKNIIDITE